MDLLDEYDFPPRTITELKQNRFLCISLFFFSALQLVTNGLNALTNWGWEEIRRERERKWKKERNRQKKERFGNLDRDNGVAWSGWVIVVNWKLALVNSKRYALKPGPREVMCERTKPVCKGLSKMNYGVCEWKKKKVRTLNSDWKRRSVLDK